MINIGIIALNNKCYRRYTTIRKVYILNYVKYIMEREKIILSDLDLKILKYIEEEKSVTEIVDKFEFSFSQCKRHLSRLSSYISIRKYGTFRFVKVNSNGEKVLEVLR